MKLAECHFVVREAHDYLARNGKEAVRRAFDVGDIRYWGSEIKRVQVLLPENGRPEFVSLKTGVHNLVEIMNQCATMERLLDALEWAQSAESGLSKFLVERCHPTTSSSQGDEEDHDLVLAGQDRTMKAKFEVSDVSGARDGNGKEKKDLISLGVLREGKGEKIYPDLWPRGRLFLVVSEEFAERLRKPSRAWLKGTLPHCRYNEVAARGTTRILEVKRGTVL